MKKRNFSLILGLCLLLASCDLSSSSSSTNNNSSNNSSSASSVSTIDKSSIISTDDTDTTISDDSTTYESTITSSGTYTLTGNVTSPVIVEAKGEEVTLVLDNCNITSPTFSAIYVKKASKVYINLVGENTIKCNNEFSQIDDNNVDGAIYSKSDLTIKGTGNLNITSIYHGIVCKDNLVLTASEITIDSEKKGIDVNDSLVTSNTTLNIISGTDGIHVENSDDSTLGYAVLTDSTFTIISERDGISTSNLLQIENGNYNITTKTSDSGSDLSLKGLKSTTDMSLTGATITVNSTDDSIHSNSNVVINSGTLTLTSGDDGIHADSSLTINGGTIDILKSYEGLEGKTVTINGGDISVVSSDDGINAAGGNDSSSFNRPGANSFSTASSDVYITITGGNIIINASGDGIDSNGNLNVSGGYIIVYGPTDNGNGALDYDGAATITGGTICAIGYSGMAQNFSAGTQGSILYNSSSNLSSNSTITLKDSSGNVLFTITSKKAFNSVVISTPDITKGSTYTLTLGSTSTSITMSSLLYSNGTSQGGGNVPGGGSGGGRPGGR